MEDLNYKANENHKLEIETENGRYLRIPIKTQVIHKGDNLEDLLENVKPHLEEGDAVFVSEKVISIIQDRVYNIKDVDPSGFAKFLCKHVGQNDDSNLKDPHTMQLAIEEAGVVRIFFAAAMAAVTKVFGMKGVFYIIAGSKVRGIDSPDEETLPPYDQYVSLIPDQPEKIAKEMEKILGHTSVVIDANYKGVNVLGISDERELTAEMAKDIFRDNPLGQAREQTPLAIVRKVK